MKRRIRLTESDLHRIVKESVKNILKESKRRDFEELKEYLDEWAYGKDVDEVGEFLKSKGAEYCDEGIDDGGDEDDEYILYRVYSIGKYDIKLYFSNLDYNVSYIHYRG